MGLVRQNIDSVFSSTVFPNPEGSPQVCLGDIETDNRTAGNTQLQNGQQPAWFPIKEFGHSTTDILAAPLKVCGNNLACYLKFPTVNLFNG